MGDDCPRCGGRGVPEISAWSQAAYGGFSGVTGCVKEEGRRYRNGISPLARRCYITYACDEEDEGLDAAAIDEILSTLVPGDSLAT